jgi:hypothetical protein
VIVLPMCVVWCPCDADRVRAEMGLEGISFALLGSDLAPRSRLVLDRVRVGGGSEVVLEAALAAVCCRGSRVLAVVGVAIDSAKVEVGAT